MKLRNKKTGEIKTPQEVISEALNKYGIISLNALNEEWEDYTPKEPLIKDERIRKAVKAWANVLSIEHIHVLHDEDIYCIFRSEFSNLEIQFDGSFEEQIKNGVYTVKELCGEEDS